MDIAQAHRNVALAAPREHAKSTWFSLVYPLWCILYEKKSFIVIISDTATQAEDFLGTIVEELETNDKVIQDFGKLAGHIPESAKEKQKWTTREIVTLTGIKVVARGWKSKLRGMKFGAIRPDLVLLDDVENDENVESELQREKVRKIFTRSILNLGSKDTQIIMVGTILHFDALLINQIKKIEKGKIKGWYAKTYRAIQGDGTPLWEAWWSKKRLTERKLQIGSIAFEQEFMNNPLDPSKAIIAPDWIRYYNGNWERREGAGKGIFVQGKKVQVFTGVDPAISEKDTADFFALVTIGVTFEGDVYVLNRIRGHFQISKQVELLFEEHKRFGFESVTIIETVAYQEGLSQEFKRLGAKKRWYPAVDAVVPDKDKVRRTIAVSPIIENGHFYIPDFYTDLYEELIQFPKGANDDMVDAVTYGLQKVRVVPEPASKLEKLTEKERNLITKGVMDKKF